MESNYQYYSELASSSLKQQSTDSVCIAFNKLLEATPAAKRKIMMEWCLALVHQHKLTVEGKTSQYPYEPIVARSTRNCQLITYDLNALPNELRAILVRYMSDCIESCAKN